MRRTLISPVTLGFVAALPAPNALAQRTRATATTHVIKLSGFTFGGKKVKLTKAGTYGFYCAPHRALGMTATVTAR